jgi:hypothetical protein
MFGADNLVPLRGLGGGAALLTGSCAFGSTSGYSLPVLAGLNRCHYSKGIVCAKNCELSYVLE